MSNTVTFATWVFELRSASDLRAAMRTSLRDAEYLGGPYVQLNREVDVPAWSWLGELCLLRSDWLSAVAAALFDVIRSGTAVERTALVDALANETATVRLLPWTAAWAMRCGEWTGTRAGTGWGGSSTAPRLDRVLADHDEYAIARASRWKPGTVRELLSKQIRRVGTWDAVPEHVAYIPGAAEALGDALPTALRGDASTGCAALDYLALGQDAWRWRELIHEWRREAPTWAQTPLKGRPRGWKRKPRWSHDGALRTWADLAARFETVAAGQTPPVMDLPLP